MNNEGIDKDMKEDNELLPEGIAIEDISDLPLIKKLRANSLRTCAGYIRVSPGNMVFPVAMKKCLKRIQDFEVLEDDIWISSFMKCGTTWTQEMVWCVKHLDFEKAKEIDLRYRVPWLEMTGYLEESLPGLDSFAEVKKTPSPRIIKSHMKFNMLPKQIMENKAKLISVVRNPRDVCVSYCKHWQLFYAYKGSFHDFAELFLNDLCMDAPFWPFVLSYWNQRHQPNVLVLRYEEMKKDLPSVLRMVARFLDKELTDEDVSKLANHLSFDNMKGLPSVNKKDELDRILISQQQNDTNDNDNPAESGFIRKGQVGNWKEYFDEDLLEKFKNWENEGQKNSDLKFVYEL